MTDSEKIHNNQPPKKLKIQDLCITENHIIKIQFGDKKYLYGYDLITEKFVKVLIKDCRPFPKIMLQLISNEKLKILILDQLCSDLEHAAEVSRLSVRNISTLRKRHNIFYNED